MERGTIKSYDHSNGRGMISHAESPDVVFSSSNIIGRDQVYLKPGDQVWFEIENINDHHTAINVRRCL